MSADPYEKAREKLREMSTRELARVAVSVGRQLDASPSNPTLRVVQDLCGEELAGRLADYRREKVERDWWRGQLLWRLKMRQLELLIRKQQGAEG